MVDSTFTPDAAAQARVEAAWAAASARPGVNLFDGPLCRLERLEATAEHLHLDVSRTTYKWFMGTNGAHPEHAPRADAVGTSAALVSGDGWLVFGRRSPSVALYPGCAHPFGGTVEPAEPIDLLGEMERELHEEVGLATNDLSDLRCVGLGEDQRLRQPELLYLARTPLPRAELERRLDRGEHTACWCVRATAEEVTRAAEDPGLTPVTQLILERFRELC